MQYIKRYKLWHMHGILLIVGTVYSFLMNCNLIKDKKDASQQGVALLDHIMACEACEACEAW